MIDLIGFLLLAALILGPLAWLTLRDLRRVPPPQRMDEIGQGPELDCWERRR